ncbi:hypothetical protein [uncultured Limosilactobacillus sp.]|uniref:hypothetical protein n=1 Tax=uncultured Limosilactobacillus sp. TaxID=2837629 RepID=UPI00272C00D2|nr:hypothetical protein [uncultured Limosilactobacillus sp.]
MQLRSTTPLSNAYFLGLATASAIITLGLNAPSALAADMDDQPSNIIKTVKADKTPQLETVQVKRVIYFHLLSGSQKVEQVSYAHRQVSGNTTKWTIEPFDDVPIPQQVRFKPTLDKIPAITEVDDLSYFDRSIDVFYHPLDEEDEEDAHVDQKTKDNETQTEHNNIKTKDEQVGTAEIQNKDEAVQSEVISYSDKATNTIEILTKDVAIQQDNQGVDISTITNPIEQTSQETQTNVFTNDQGVGDDEVVTRDIGVGIEDYRYKDQKIQTDNLIISQADATTMTDFVNTNDIRTGDNKIDDLNQKKSETPKVTASSQTVYHTNEIGVGDEEPIVITTGDIDKGDKSTQTNAQELKDSITQTESNLQDSKQTQTIVPLSIEQGTTMEITNNDQEIQTDSYQIDYGTQTDNIASKETGTQTVSAPKHNETTSTYQQPSVATQTNDSDNHDQSIQVKDGDEQAATNTSNFGPLAIADDLTPASCENNQTSTNKIKGQKIEGEERSRNTLHKRIAKANHSLVSLTEKATQNNKRNRQKSLPQTDNNTSTLTTLAGIGITLLTAGMSLFSLHKQQKSKIK